MIRRSPIRRQLRETQRIAQAAALTVEDRTRAAAAETATLNAGDAATGEWAPFGILGVTALDSFRLAGSPSWGILGVTSLDHFRLKG